MAKHNSEKVTERVVFKQLPLYIRAQLRTYTKGMLGLQKINTNGKIKIPVKLEFFV